MAMLVGKVNAAYDVQMKKWVCPCSCGLVLTTHGRSINRNGQVRCLCPFSTPTLHGLTVCVDRIAQCGRAFKTKDDLLQHWNVLEETCTISKISHATLVPAAQAAFDVGNESYTKVENGYSYETFEGDIAPLIRGMHGYFKGIHDMDGGNLGNFTFDSDGKFNNTDLYSKSIKLLGSTCMDTLMQTNDQKVREPYSRALKASLTKVKEARERPGALAKLSMFFGSTATDLMTCAEELDKSHSKLMRSVMSCETKIELLVVQHHNIEGEMSRLKTALRKLSEQGDEASEERKQMEERLQALLLQVGSLEAELKGYSEALLSKASRCEFEKLQRSVADLDTKLTGQIVALGGEVTELRREVQQQGRQQAAQQVQLNGQQEDISQLQQQQQHTAQEQQRQQELTAQLQRQQEQLAAEQQRQQERAAQPVVDTIAREAAGQAQATADAAAAESRKLTEQQAAMLLQMRTLLEQTAAHGQQLRAHDDAKAIALQQLATLRASLASVHAEVAAAHAEAQEAQEAQERLMAIEMLTERQAKRLSALEGAAGAVIGRAVELERTQQRMAAAATEGERTAQSAVAAAESTAARAEALARALAAAIERAQQVEAWSATSAAANCAEIAQLRRDTAASFDNVKVLEACIAETGQMAWLDVNTLKQILNAQGIDTASAGLDGEANRAPPLPKAGPSRVALSPVASRIANAR